MITVFDLDGVLSRADTMAALIVYVNRRRPWRVALVAPAVLCGQFASPSGRTRAALNRWAVRHALRGVSMPEYRSAAQAVARNLSRTADNFPAQARHALRAARAAGPVWVATASEHTMAAAYLKQIGCGDLPLTASSLSPGAEIHLVVHNVGESKVSALNAAGVQLAGAHLFTDSASDIPLARTCEHTTLVNPGSRSKRMFLSDGLSFSLARW